MDKLTHLSVDDLVLFMDRELDQSVASVAEQHLLNCVECGNKLRLLEQGSAAYGRYHEHVLKADLRVPDTGWGRLSDRLRPRQRRNWGIWWAAAAFAGLLAFVSLYLPLRQQPSAQELLTKAAAAPEPVGGVHWRLVSSNPPIEHVHALFVQANYSWTNPLSARSFVAWRQRLPEKSDYVTTLRQDGRQFYRVRTQTSSGILHSAALTLEAVNYHPTHASFEFQGDDPVEIAEQDEVTPDETEQAKATSPPSAPNVAETLAGPEDELRVFAALDAIGADAEEPIDVKLDHGHHNVLVTGMGMRADRRKQIETALAALPNTVVRFSSAVRNDTPDKTPSESNTGTEANNAVFRKKLQDLAGGVRQLQTITDEATETSNSLFAQSHSLLVLAQEFPPGIESSLSQADANTLLSLRQRHIGAMSYALRRLRDQLKPLLTEDVLITESAKQSSWHSTANELYETSRNLDHLLSRLLAGDYNDSDGDQMLKQLPDDLSKVETLVKADSR